MSVFTTTGTAVTALSNGNYVVASPHWSSNKGAITWVNGSTGQTGNSTNTISSGNSLVGSTTGDFVGAAAYPGTATTGSFEPVAISTLAYMSGSRARSGLGSTMRTRAVRVSFIWCG